MFLFSFVNPEHERRAARDHPRGVSRRRPRLALPRGDGAGPGVRAGVHDARERLRGAEDRRVRRPAAGRSCAPPATAGQLLDHAVDRRGDAARLRRPPGGVGAGVRPDRRRDGRGRCAAGKAGVEDFVAVDMGGTSFDVCLVRDGQPEIKTDWNWRYRYYIGLPMVDVQSVGAGGGSIARVRQGALLVGPESAGSDARTGLLRTRRHPADGHRRRRRARVPPARRVRRRPHDTRPRRRTRRHPTRRRRATRTRRRRGGVGHRAHRQRQHGERDPPGAGVTRRRRPGAGADRVRRQRRRARVGDRHRARHRPHPRPEGGAGVLRPRACSSPTTSSTSYAPTSSRCRRSTSRACTRSCRELQDEARKELDPTGLADTQVDVGLLRADVLPGPELRHERARPRSRRRSTSPGSSTSPSGSTTSTRPTAASVSATSSRCYAAYGSSPAATHPSPSAWRPSARSATRRRRGEARGACTSGPSSWDRVSWTRPSTTAPCSAPASRCTGPRSVEEPFTVVVLPPGATARLDELGNYALTVS